VCATKRSKTPADHADGLPARLTVFERAFLGDPTEDLATLIRRDFWRNPVLINAVLQGYCSSGPGTVKGYFDRDLLREIVLIQILEIMTWSADDDPDFYRQTKLIAEEILFADDHLEPHSLNLKCEEEMTLPVPHLNLNSDS
jgi:hypothetical protein